MRKLTALGACILGAGALAACTTTDPYTGQVVRNNTGTGALAGAGAAPARRRHRPRPRPRHPR